MDGKRWKFMFDIATGDKKIPEVLAKPEKKKAIREWIFDKLETCSNDKKEILFIVIEKLNLLPYSLHDYYRSLMRKDLQQGSKSGANCPVCDRYLRVYKRAFNANMAMFLKSLVINSVMEASGGGDGYIHYSKCNYTGRDYTCLQYWGLAETMKDEEGKKKMSGYWKPTSSAFKFIKGETKVSKYVFTLNGDVLSFAEEKVSFEDALGTPFNYKDMMDSVSSGEGYEYN